MYGNYSALDRDINYLMHYNTKGSHWYHIGDGKRQENPKKYAKGAATIGFDPSKYEKSKLWTKLKGKQNDLKDKATQERAKAAANKKLSEDAKKESKSNRAEAEKLAKDYDSFVGGFKKFFDKKYKSETPIKIEELIDYSNKKSKESKERKKQSKSFARKAFMNDIAYKLMNVPIKAVEFGIRTKDRIDGAMKSIGSIKIGKKTIVDRAKDFGGFVKSLMFGNKNSNNQKNGTPIPTLPPAPERPRSNYSGSRELSDQAIKYLNNPSKAPHKYLYDSASNFLTGNSGRGLSDQTVKYLNNPSKSPHKYLQESIYDNTIGRLFNSKQKRKQSYKKQKTEYLNSLK